MGSSLRPGWAVPPQPPQLLEINFQTVKLIDKYIRVKQDYGNPDR